MTCTEITDQSGKTLTLKEVGGRFYPNFPTESIENVFTFPARSDDVLLCTHPKSGTHWTSEIIRFLMEGSTSLPTMDKADSMIELSVPSVIEALPSPRGINTHFHFKSLSPEFFKQKCKFIYVTRDPRDAVISYFKHVNVLKHMYKYDGEWKDFFQLYLDGKMEYGSWFEYTKGWEKGMRDNPDQSFLVMSFEAMKEDPLKEVKRVDEFLGTNHSDNILEEIVEKTSFKAMKEKRVSSGTQFAGLFRKGQVGDWKNWFTVAQMEQFNEVFEREMVGTDAYKLYSHTLTS